jgi:hypothetical protein
MITLSDLLTPFVPIVNVELVEPPGIWTDTGTLASELVEEILTIAPVLPAG